jgi:hypothetical protein
VRVVRDFNYATDPAEPDSRGTRPGMTRWVARRGAPQPNCVPLPILSQWEYERR